MTWLRNWWRMTGLVGSRSSHIFMWVSMVGMFVAIGVALHVLLSAEISLDAAEIAADTWGRRHYASDAPDCVAVDTFEVRCTVTVGDALIPLRCTAKGCYIAY